MMNTIVMAVGLASTCMLVCVDYFQDQYIEQAVFVWMLTFSILITTIALNKPYLMYQVCSISMWFILIFMYHNNYSFFFPPFPLLSPLSLGPPLR